MELSQLRSAFLSFYQDKGHIQVPGDSTIPKDDPTILFTIAGMAQFKDTLAGKKPAEHPRITNVQKCIRAADLEDVGLDGRHLTMFEMLGLWSFGDYSKKESIAWAWEFITEVLRLDTSRIWASVHTSDDESKALWQAVGLPSERIVVLGDEDNFWSMGSSGPCGPCTEIYYDQGPEVGCCAQVCQGGCASDPQGANTPEEPPRLPVCRGPGCDCDRYLEFWNNVFMEFNRHEDGTLEPLPQKNVDTGVGLERLTAICQGKTSAYETDAFQALEEAVIAKLGLSQIGDRQRMDVKDRQSVQVICDHIRTLTVTLTDGATFSNAGRGYVLRRILRRAVRFAHRFRSSHGLEESTPVLHLLVADVAAGLGQHYVEIAQEAARVSGMIREEESRFLRTLEAGLKHFAERAEGLKKGDIFSGDALFELHDTFGFPADLSALLCRERGFVADVQSFETHMRKQQERSRAHSQFHAAADEGPFVWAPECDRSEVGRFIGYDALTADLPSEELFSEISAEAPEIGDRQNWRLRGFPPENILAVRRRESVPLVDVIVRATILYPEGGGQVCDQGLLSLQQEAGHPPVLYAVRAVHKAPEGLVLSLDAISEAAHQNRKADSASLLNSLRHPHLMFLNARSRMNAARHHTATHLLHAALRNVLGDHVRQAGSQVTPSGLRFDFSHPKGLTAAEREKIEHQVYTLIEHCIPVETLADVPIEAAREMGALAMFGEKYGSKVRVLRVGSASIELCGGTHVSNTSEIGDFRIVSEGSVTSGVRRIEALAGPSLRMESRQREASLASAAELLKCSPNDLVERIANLKALEKDQEKRIQQLEQQIASQASASLSQQTQAICPGLSFIAHNLGPIQNAQEIERIGDELKEKTKGVVVIGAVYKDKPQLLALVHPEVRTRFAQVSAGQLIKALAPVIAGKGGGKPEFARAGGSNLEALPQALEAAATELKKQAGVL